MYTRTYGDREDEIKIPENYAGCAFDEPEVIHTDSQEAKEITYDEPSEPVMARSEKNGGLEKSFLSRFFGGGLHSFEPKAILSGLFSDFGTEEILLIGVAVFLLFSKSGDVETLIMLLLLLFIK